MTSTRDLDRADVHRVLAGDVEAFSGIVERWQRPLVNLAYRFCRNHGLAEEMAQEAFLRVFQRLHQWREDAAFSTWLFAVALNSFRSGTLRIPKREAPLEDARELAAPGNVLDDIAARQDKELVRRVVQTLPRRYREAIVLFYFFDQNVSEAAGVLAIPEGTFKARLHRGRALLEVRLGRLVDEHDRRRHESR